MRKNLLKQLILALLITVAVPTLTAQVHVGDILCEGNAIVSPANYPSSGATAIGVVFYVDNTGQHGWAVALQDAGSYTPGTAVYSLPSYGNNIRQAIYDLDGYENTRIVRLHSEDHPAFYAVDFEHGWYVPAFGQLNYLYGNLIEVDASLKAIGGTPFGMGNWEYWSSTKWYTSGSSSFWLWTMKSSGYRDYWGDGHNCLVRAVRNF